MNVFLMSDLIIIFLVDIFFFLNFKIIHFFFFNNLCFLLLDPIPISKLSEKSLLLFSFMSKNLTKVDLLFDLFSLFSS